MKESYGKGLTNHTDLESCAVGREASLEALTPAKSPNKTGQPTVAEGMEGRALVNGNECQRNTNRAQYRRIVPSELARVCVMVKEGVHEILCLSASSLR